MICLSQGGLRSPSALSGTNMEYLLEYIVSNISRELYHGEYHPSVKALKRT